MSFLDSNVDSLDNVKTKEDGIKPKDQVSKVIILNRLCKQQIFCLIKLLLPPGEQQNFRSTRST